MAKSKSVNVRISAELDAALKAKFAKFARDARNPRVSFTEFTRLISAPERATLGKPPAPKKIIPGYNPKLIEDSF